jgi:hypothetical protein
MSWAATHYLPSDTDVNDPRLSPLRASDLSGLPPAVIHTAGFDILRDEGQAYADALERAGIKQQHVCHEHMIHHFYAMAGAIPYARTALQAMGADIKTALNAAYPLQRPSDSRGALDMPSAHSLPRVSLGYRVIRIKLHDKLVALDRLGKSIGLFKEKSESTITHQIGITDPMARIR